MAMGDIYSGLQTNIIDGAENNWPSYISFSHYEIARHYTVDGHQRVPEILVASNVAMNKLSKADQAVIAKAALASVEFQKAKWAQSEKENEAKAKAAGCSITYLTPQAQAEFQKAVQPIYAEYKEYAGLIAEIQAVK
jgi:TRAP-type C4-dicarboxylate transport system substrate-binding protein